MAPSKKIIKVFYGSNKNPENIFFACGKFPKNLFGKIRTCTHQRNRIIPDYPETIKKPLKIPFLRRDRNSGLPRAFAARFSRKTYYNRCKKMMPPEARQFA